MASAVITFAEDGDDVVLQTTFDPPITQGQMQQLAEGNTEGIPETHIAAIIAVTQAGNQYGATADDYTILAADEPIN